jgi:hypothetical protein
MSAGSFTAPASATGTHASGAPFRAHARRAVRIEALVTHLQAGWQQRAAVENIGLGGARVVVDRPVAAGDALSLSFTAPTLWDPLVLRGQVAWVGRPPVAQAAVAQAAAGPRPVGVAFDHKATDAVFALYELIVTLGYE